MHGKHFQKTLPPPSSVLPVPALLEVGRGYGLPLICPLAFATSPIVALGVDLESMRIDDKQFRAGQHAACVAVRPPTIT